jgi:hypothetical protein
MHEVSSPQNRMLNDPEEHAHGAQAYSEGLLTWGHAGLEHRLEETVRAFAITTRNMQRDHIKQWL